ncbi:MULTISPECIES: MBOAT family protein [unclassified Fusibacter]|uniref:MBOAT family O-acyltransferase n=1 Tax=unclassified Fusibacter TaxID=2624464 RepID=UPI001010E310|nr:MULTISPECIES: MBOAT family O-acyltransferase [unclassified Fusibacter]MCK8060187.1 MBOAT family protein [Fusibacter sp. A2]NPE22327.1 MBOAT family protein [Fusibacter sp. A1]RXV61100.1 MBOAT family protein [Fusibacter sp. A1]
MLFSSISFIYYFLPIVFAIYFLVPYKFKNFILLIASLLFYFFGEPKYTFLLLLSTLVDYLHSLVIHKHRGTRKAKAALISSIAINLSILGFFKYYDFFIENINHLFHLNLLPLGLTLPIGISFFTFQTMSYTIDVYRNEAEIQRSPLGLATYISLFPQLIAGPIVRYKTVAKEINHRVHNFDLFAYGVKRFIIGLAKKVLIANQLGELSALSHTSGQPSVMFYWLGAVAFSLQIYFDFSGYSDMAIGLGRIFGFHFLENFNYPYISKSITEFWSRWHISLGAWFKDYVYIPLGGNRVGKLKWYRNILIVWFATGFWHGASWNYVLWGIYFGALLVLEKLVLSKRLIKSPALVQHAYVLFIIVISFVIFQNEDFSVMTMRLKGMFGLLDLPLASSESVYYFRSYAVVIAISLLAATPIPNRIIKNLEFNKSARLLSTIVEPVCYLLLLIVITGYLVDASFNPFLYFRF